MRERPTLRQYGLEYTDIEALIQDYNDYVEHEKNRYLKSAQKMSLGFVFILFTWCAPLMGVVIILDLIFKWDMSPGTLVFMFIYTIAGSVFLYYWGKWAKDADNAKKGTISIDRFARKAEWEQYSKYKADCEAFILQEKRINGYRSK